MNDVEKFVPMYDNVLIRKAGEEVKSAGGIIIANPELSKSYAEGEVITVGEGYKLQDGTIRPLKVKTGDVVIFRKMTEISIELDGVEYFVLSEANVMGIR